jgi:hypothetical protein
MDTLETPTAETTHARDNGFRPQFSLQSLFGMVTVVAIFAGSIRNFGVAVTAGVIIVLLMIAGTVTATVLVAMNLQDISAITGQAKSVLRFLFLAFAAGNLIAYVVVPLFAKIFLN